MKIAIHSFALLATTFLLLNTSCTNKVPLPIANEWVEVIELDSTNYKYFTGDVPSLHKIWHSDYDGELCVQKHLIYANKIRAVDSIVDSNNKVLRYTISLDLTSYHIEPYRSNESMPDIYKWTQVDNEGKAIADNTFLAVPRRDEKIFTINAEQYPQLDIKLLPVERIAGKWWLKNGLVENDIEISFDGGKEDKLMYNNILSGGKLKHEGLVATKIKPNLWRMWIDELKEFVELEIIKEGNTDLYVVKQGETYPYAIKPFIYTVTDTLIEYTGADPFFRENLKNPENELNYNERGVRIIYPIYQVNYAEVYDQYLSKGNTTANVLANDDLTAYINYKYPELQGVKPSFTRTCDERYSSSVSHNLRYTIYHIPSDEYDDAHENRLDNRYKLIVTSKLNSPNEPAGYQKEVKSQRRIVLEMEMILPYKGEITKFDVNNNASASAYEYNGDNHTLSYNDFAPGTTAGSMTFTMFYQPLASVDDEAEGILSEMQDETLTLTFDQVYNNEAFGIYGTVQNMNKRTWVLTWDNNNGEQLALPRTPINLKDMPYCYPFEILEQQ